MRVAQDATGKECGLHSGNVVASAAEQAQQEAVRDLWDSDSNVRQLSHDQLASLLDGRRDKSTVLVMYAPWCQYSQVCLLPSSLAVLIRNTAASRLQTYHYSAIPLRQIRCHGVLAGDMLHSMRIV